MRVPLFNRPQSMRRELVANMFSWIRKALGMNLVTTMTKQLNARRSELEQSQASLAQHQALLEQAKVELAASNGDFDVWQGIDERVRFEQRQVERYAGIVEQCSANVECARAALASAQHDSEVEKFRSAIDDRKVVATTLVRTFVDMLERARSMAAQLDGLQQDEVRDCIALRELGAQQAPANLANAVALEIMNRNPGCSVLQAAHLKYSGLAGMVAPSLCATSRVMQGGSPVTGDTLRMVLAQERVRLGDESAREQLPPPEVFKLPEGKVGTVSHFVRDASGNKHEFFFDEWSTGELRVPESARERARFILDGDYSELEKAKSRCLLDLPTIIHPTPAPETFSVRYITSGNEAATQI
jgi:hypothetical protein